MCAVSEWAENIRYLAAIANIANVQNWNIKYRKTLYFCFVRHYRDAEIWVMDPTQAFKMKALINPIWTCAKREYSTVQVKSSCGSARRDSPVVVTFSYLCCYQTWIKWYYKKLLLLECACRNRWSQSKTGCHPVTICHCRGSLHLVGN